MSQRFEHSLLPRASARCAIGQRISKICAPEPSLPAFEVMCAAPIDGWNRLAIGLRINPAAADSRAIV